MYDIILLDKIANLKCKSNVVWLFVRNMFILYCNTTLLNCCKLNCCKTKYIIFLQNVIILLLLYNCWALFASIIYIIILSFKYDAAITLGKTKFYQDKYVTLS